MAMGVSVDEDADMANYEFGCRFWFDVGIIGVVLHRGMPVAMYVLTSQQRPPPPSSPFLYVPSFALPPRILYLTHCLLHGHIL